MVQENDIIKSAKQFDEVCEFLNSHWPPYCILWEEVYRLDDDCDWGDSLQYVDVCRFIISSTMRLETLCTRTTIQVNGTVSYDYKEFKDLNRI